MPPVHNIGGAIKTTCYHLCECCTVYHYYFHRITAMR